jgi:hypothetical protein
VHRQFEVVFWEGGALKLPLDFLEFVVEKECAVFECRQFAQQLHLCLLGLHADLSLIGKQDELGILTTQRHVLPFIFGVAADVAIEVDDLRDYLRILLVLHISGDCLEFLDDVHPLLEVGHQQLLDEGSPSAPVYMAVQLGDIDFLEADPTEFLVLDGLLLL